MQLPHAMVIDGSDEAGENTARDLKFQAHGDDTVHIGVGIYGALYNRDRLTNFLRLVVDVLESGERGIDGEPSARNRDLMTTIIDNWERNREGKK